MDDMVLEHTAILKEHDIKILKLEENITEQEQRITKLEDNFKDLTTHLSALSTKVDITNKILFSILSILITALISYLLK